jgi:ribose transport system permease protein
MTRASLASLIVPSLVSIGLIAIAIANPVFFSWANLSNVLLQASIIGVISLGMTPVIIAGGIDLSVGGIVAVSAIVLAKACGAGWPAVAATALALGVALACGIVNGAAVAFFGVPSFIATLGMMGIARGFALLISGGEPLSEIGGVSRFLGSGKLWGMPMPIAIFIGVGLILYVFLRSSIWGIRLYAIGGNVRAAWISGVDIKGYLLATFAVCGLLAGLAGIAVAGRLGSAQPLAGNLYELDSITAAVLGGATLSGGRGSALGTAAGAILLAAIRNAMVLVNLSPYLHQIVIGLVLIAVLLADYLRRGGKDPLEGL